jgi:hypothetical protein
MITTSIMSWNLNEGKGNYKEAALRCAKEREGLVTIDPEYFKTSVVETIVDFSRLTDIFTLQEVTLEIYKDLKSRLGDKFELFYTHRDQGGEEYHPDGSGSLLIVSKELKIIGDVQETYVEPEENYTPSVIQSVEIKLPEDDKTLMVLNIHGPTIRDGYDHKRDCPERERVFGKVESLACNHQGPLVISGDYNSYPDIDVVTSMADRLGCSNAIMEYRVQDMRPGMLEKFLKHPEWKERQLHAPNSLIRSEGYQLFVFDQIKFSDHYPHVDLVTN